MKLLMLALAFAAMLSAQPPDRARAQEDYAFSAGVQAYLYGYPLVLMAATERAILARGTPANHFAHVANLSTPASRFVVLPNVDTLYSSAWLDLAQGPLWFHVPEIKGRYYTFQFMDAYSDNFAYVGSRLNHGAAADYAILPPHWSGDVPAGLRKIESTTPVVWLLVRILAGEVEDDLQAARALQHRCTLAPLRDYEKSAPPDPPVAIRPPAQTTPPKVVAAMNAAAFFADLARLMSTNHPHSIDQALVHQFAAIGLVPGRDFDLEKLDAPVRRGLERAVASARAMIESKIGATGPTRNGWQFYDIGKWGDDFLRRASFAWLALAGNDPEEAIYTGAFHDSEGRTLSGAHDYRLHFDAGRMPPAYAFWSVTMYDADGYLVENPIRRYAIRDRTPGLRYNSDGSLDIYISRTQPAGQEANWLPAAPGELSIVLRLYLPKPEVLDGSWQPPSVVRVN